MRYILIGIFAITIYGIAFYLTFVTQASPYQLLTYEPPLTTQIYDKDGQLLYQVYEHENRVWKNLEDIDDDLIEATIAMEDRRFYHHQGVDLIAIARALKATFIEGELQGGSTLTQQYIKNAVLTNERVWSRKINEAYLALILEAVEDKDSILEKYLNQTAYGGVYHGVETAAQYYFGKSASDLTLAEAAYLAAIPKAPSELDPQKNMAGLTERQQLVLEAMKANGYITEEEKEKALSEKVEFKYAATGIRAPHFVLSVRDKLIEDLGREQVYRGGLSVRTTLDMDIQEMAEKIMRKEAEDLKRYNINNGAVVILDPKTGQVLSMVGSRDYFDQKNDGNFNVIYGYRQPGSLLKPITYALAFESGYHPATILLDVETTYVTNQGIYKPVNYDSQYHGPTPIRKALGNSYNIPATRMLAVIGTENLINRLNDMGFNYVKGENTGLSLTLGGYEVRPIDMAAAYGMLANLGKYTESELILEVKDRRDKVIYESDPQFKQIFTDEVAYLVSDILADNEARRDAFGLNSQLNTGPHKVAVKTGTSNNKRDNWTIGYTPEWVVAVWVGNNDHAPMNRVASGLTGASQIWRRITDEMIAEGETSWYEKPKEIVEKEVDTLTGLKYCGKGKKQTELFIRGSEPRNCSDDNVLAYADSKQHILVEKRGEDEVQVDTLSDEEYEGFQQNPFAYIEANKDKLQADDIPTAIYVKESIYADSELMRELDPLARISDSPTMINLSSI